MRIDTFGAEAVLVVDGVGPSVTVASLTAAMGEAFDGRASVIAIGVERLEPGFFELRSGVAGEIVQKLVNYRLRLVVVGELPAMALASRSFSAFVVEGNRGQGPWFVRTLAELRDRMDPAS